MSGINLRKPIQYLHSSLRFFNPGEFHISRLCQDDVLLLVYDGVLRFTEDGIAYEIGPGQYHIQHRNSAQSGSVPSDAPKYLYVHFLSEWTDDSDALPRSGSFSIPSFQPLMERLDHLAHSHAPYVLQTALFYQLLSDLYHSAPKTQSSPFSDYVELHYRTPITLNMLCQEFHYSKNQIIHTFQKEFGMTPITYINHLRLKKAEYLIEVTSERLEDISTKCGFQNYSHFYKQFIRKNGSSPEQWRTQKRIR